MIATIATAWALTWLVVAAVLVAASGRIGRARAGAWLVLAGLFLIVIEEPALTLWLALSDPHADKDGMATLVTAMARAHVLDAGVYALAAAVLLGWIAITSLRRGRRPAWWLLVCALVVVAASETVTTVVVYSRGLPIPGVPGRDAFGWQPIAVGLLAWAAGLLLARPVPDRPTPEAPTQPQVADTATSR
jgi:hypothetical protein